MYTVGDQEAIDCLKRIYGVILPEPGKHIYYRFDFVKSEKGAKVCIENRGKGFYDIYGWINFYTATNGKHFTIEDLGKALEEVSFEYESEIDGVVSWTTNLVDAYGNDLGYQVVATAFDWDKEEENRLEISVEEDLPLMGDDGSYPLCDFLRMMTIKLDTAIRQL